MVHTYTRKKKKRTQTKKVRRRQNEAKEKKINPFRPRNEHPVIVQTKSQESKVAVGWYDRPYAQLVHQQKDDTKYQTKQ